MDPPKKEKKSAKSDKSKSPKKTTDKPSKVVEKDEKNLIPNWDECKFSPVDTKFMPAPWTMESWTKEQLDALEAFKTKVSICMNSCFSFF